jgi:hypothetical protein
MSLFRRVKVKELFPPEILLHLDRISETVINKWEEFRYSQEYFPNSINNPNFRDYANTLQLVVEKRLIDDSEFTWLAVKAGVIAGQINRVLDYSWRDQSPGVRDRRQKLLNYLKLRKKLQKNMKI